MPDLLNLNTTHRYGPDNTLRTRGLFLFSKAVAFDHPVIPDLHLNLNVTLPEIYGNTMNMERKKSEVQKEQSEQNNE